MSELQRHKEHQRDHELNLCTPEERARRWRLILGGAHALRAQESAEGSGSMLWGQQPLSGEDQAMDEALSALYGSGEGAEGDDERGGSLADSAPNISKWLGDVQRLFPPEVVQVMQRDALERLDLVKTLTSPELSELITPDIHLVSQLVGLAKMIPDEAKVSARRLIKQLVEELTRRFEAPMRQSVMGSLNRRARNLRPRPHEVDWHRTIKLNLKHYQPSLNAIIPERVVGFGRHRSELTELLLCVDQSGSMSSSVVYASIFAGVLSALPALKTRLILFDTSVVELTDELSEPAELLFGLQLGGGTNIGKALTYCTQSVSRPSDTIMVLISDMYEGGEAGVMFERAQELVQSGVRLICLLALSDEGKPSYDARAAQKLTKLGAPCFACSPDMFPELMGVALSGGDCQAWAAQVQAGR